MVQIAELNSNVWLSLGKPGKELCDLDEIYNATRHALVYRFADVGLTSDNNQFLETSPSFTPTSSPFDIGTELGKNTPAWLEAQVGDRWVPVRCVNLSLLEQMRDEGVTAAAFHGNSDNETYVSFSYLVSAQSNTVYRIRYDLMDASFAIDNAKEVKLPDNLLPLIEIDAQQFLIPRMQVRLAGQIEDEDGRKLMVPKLDALTNLHKQNEHDIETKWLPLYRVWKNRARTAQTERRLPRRSGRGFYGGGR